MAEVSRTISLEKYGDEMLRRSSAPVPLRGPLMECSVAISADLKRNFATGTAPDGTAWAPVKSRVRKSKNILPLRDRGLLMASAIGNAATSIKVITDVSLTQGTNLEYAGTHQYGGVIVPTKAKALAIPLTIEAFRAGSPRKFPFPLFLWTRPGKAPFLAESKQKGRGKKGFTELIFHYILLKSVKIPARPFMGFSDRLMKKIDDIFARFARKNAGG